MERRLWYGITWPSMILTYIFGFWLAYSMFGLLFPAWLLLKFSVVFGLTLYHLQCGVMHSKFQKGVVKYSSFTLRLWNEVATLFLVAVVFIVVLKGQGNWWWGVIGLVVFALLLMLAVSVYKKRREMKK